MSRRRGGHLRGRSRWRGYRWLALLGSTAGVALLIYFSAFADQHDRGLKLSGFLGTVWAEGWPDKVNRLEYPPMKNQGPGDKPAYVLLHPETPPMQVVPEKNGPKPRPARQPKARKAPPSQTKTAKAVAPPSKKDKAAARIKAKKKKASSPGNQKAAPG